MVYFKLKGKTVEKVDSCCNGFEWFGTAKQRIGEKKDVVGVSCWNDESGAVKVSVSE